MGPREKSKSVMGLETREDAAGEAIASFPMMGLGLEERRNPWLGEVRGGMRVPAEVDEVRAGPEMWAARFCGMGPDAGDRAGGVRDAVRGERLAASLGEVVREWWRHPLLWP